MDVDTSTMVDVWIDSKGWHSVPAGKAFCPDCGQKYNDDFWWDETTDHRPFLVCACGGQMFLTEDRED